MRTATPEVKIWNRSRLRPAQAARSGVPGQVTDSSSSFDRLPGTMVIGTRI